MDHSSDFVLPVIGNIEKANTYYERSVCKTSEEIYIEQVSRKKTEFAQLAPLYDLYSKVFSLGMKAKLHKVMAQMAKGPGDGPVLELCCGTGALTIELAREFEHVLGIDLSPAMLKRAKKRIEKKEMSNIELRESEISTLDFPEHSFAAIAISLGLHELPLWIREPMFEVCLKWLKPQGRLVICDYSKPKNPISAAIFRVIGRPLIEKELFVDYLDYPLQDRLESFGYKSIEKRRFFLSCFEMSAWKRVGKR